MGRNILVKAEFSAVVAVLDEAQEQLLAALGSLERVKRSLALRQFEAIEPRTDDTLDTEIRKLRKRK